MKVKTHRFLGSIKRIPEEKLIFLYEAGYQEHVRRTHARAFRGAVADCHHLNQPEKDITGVGAIPESGPVVFKSYDRAITSKTFLSYFRRHLLSRLTPGDVVFMDNLRAHHGLLVKRAARRAKVKILYLPFYSPQDNPIEKIWAWMKQRLRFRLSRLAKFSLRCFWRMASGQEPRPTSFYREL